MITMKFYSSSTVNDPRSPIFPVESWKKIFKDVNIVERNTNTSDVVKLIFS